MEQANQGTKEAFLATPRFEETRSYSRLTELAKRAPNISLSGAITPERMTSMMSEGAGLTLLYGFNRVDGEILQELQALANERGVVDQMKALFSGEVVNWIEGYESERRAVLHPATRDIFGIATTSDSSARRLVEGELQRLREFFDHIGDTYTTLLFIGIGGSELGPRALAEAMERYAIPGRQVRYLANVDPDEATAALAGIDLKRTLVAVISKSGATLRDGRQRSPCPAGLLHRRDRPKGPFRGGDMPKDDDGRSDEVSAVSFFFDFIGGRFSATSVLGGLLVSFIAGSNSFFELLGGANKMDRQALRLDMRDNLPLLLASWAYGTETSFGTPPLPSSPIPEPFAGSLRTSSSATWSRMARASTAMGGGCPSQQPLWYGESPERVRSTHSFKCFTKERTRCRLSSSGSSSPSTTRILSSTEPRRRTSFSPTFLPKPWR